MSSLHTNSNQGESIIQLDKPSENINSLFEDLNASPMEETQVMPENKEMKYFRYVQQGTSWLATISVVVVFFLSLVLYIRTLDDVNVLSALPFCQELSSFVDGYDNTNCLPIKSLISELDRKKAETEKQITKGLAAYIPAKMSAVDMRSSPEVQFILEKSGDTRRSINDMLASFTSVMNGGNGSQHIECGKITTDETGLLKVSCDVFGAGLFDSFGTRSDTARMYATDFLDRLERAKETFNIIDSPNSLELSQYNSSDLGIKSTFSTSTKVTMQLRFIPNGKM